MTIGLDVEITSGKLRAIPILGLVADTQIISGPCKLCGFSVRDVSAENTSDVSGAVVAPAALTTIVTTPALAGGTYDVNWLVGLSGAAAAAEVNNFRLVAGGANIEVSVNPGAAGNYVQISARVTVAFGQVILVQNIGVGTAAVTYDAQLEVIPAVVQIAGGELRDGNNPLAEMACVNGGVDRAWYGTEGIEVFNQILFHPVGGILTGAVYVRYDRYGD